MIANIPYRNRWLIAGTVLAVLVTLLTLLNRQISPKTERSGTEVLELTYCSEKQVKPCVVSFSLDANGNMLVNILLPDHSFPGFYLKIMHGDGEARYRCQKIAAAPSNAYCIGEELPPGETLRLMLVSARDDVLLAQGDLSIIGLAFPTVEITIPTPIGSPTEELMLAETPMSTEPSVVVLPTPTLLLPPSLMLTQTAYPNPPYPNPLYP
jgi:hypothetical protein